MRNSAFFLYDINIIFLNKKTLNIGKSGFLQLATSCLNFCNWTIIVHVDT
jgi:hypothetical protein